MSAPAGRRGRPSADRKPAGHGGADRKAADRKGGARPHAARSVRSGTGPSSGSGYARSGMAIDKDQVLKALRRPASLRELQDRLGGGREARKSLQRALRDLERSGEVVKRGPRYRLPRRDGLLEGRFAPAGGGGGRVVTDAGRSFRVRSDGGAEAGDRVLIVPLPSEPDEEARAEVLDVLEARRAEWVGIVDGQPAGAVVVPYRDDQEWGIPVSRKNLGGAKDGDVVVVVPADRQPKRGGIAGRVVEVLGRPGEAEADFRAVVWHRRIPVAFPAHVEAEARALPDLDVEAALAAGREDLRHVPFVTIDPATARDHDDAVHVEAREGGYRLWVAIADVSAHVPEGSALDSEALRRGNSVYFPDRAIPMLPERLSGDACSLRPDVGRLALAARLDLDARGRPRGRRVVRAVIRSRARLDYETAAAAMDDRPGAAEALPHPELAGDLRRLAECARKLEKRRFAAGSIDFDLPSAEIEMGDEGVPIGIGMAPRTVAHRAIEEAMLAANRAVAEWLLEHDVPALFRVHEPPDPEATDLLRDALESFGLLESRGRKDLEPKEVARALQRAAGRPEERLVNLIALRSMKQARYEHANRGHFALAFDAYLHFTSPIRRYADLVVHRAAHDLISGGADLERARRRGEGLAAVGRRVSWRERVAMNAERDMIDLKKCAFMSGHVGEEFEGTVTSVARQGLYVTLDRWFVEGLVHVSTLPEWVELDEETHSLVARDSGRRYHIGDRFRVLVDAVDMTRAWINLSIAPDN